MSRWVHPSRTTRAVYCRRPTASGSRPRVLHVGLPDHGRRLVGVDLGAAADVAVVVAIAVRPVSPVAVGESALGVLVAAQERAAYVRLGPVVVEHAACVLGQAGRVRLTPQDVAIGLADDALGLPLVRDRVASGPSWGNSPGERPHCRVPALRMKPATTAVLIFMPSPSVRAPRGVVSPTRKDIQDAFQVRAGRGGPVRPGPGRQSRSGRRASCCARRGGRRRAPSEPRRYAGPAGRPGTGSRPCIRSHGC